MLMFLLSMHTVVFWGQAPTPADSTECFYIVYLLLKINPSFPERTGNKTSLRVWIFISLVLASLFVTETWLGGQPSGARSGATHMLLSCSLLIRINGSHDTLTPQFHADTLGPCLTLSHCRRNAKKKKKKKAWLKIEVLRSPLSNFLSRLANTLCFFRRANVWCLLKASWRQYKGVTDFFFLSLTHRFRPCISMDFLFR